MNLLRIPLIFILCYYTTKLNLNLLNFLVPGCFFDIETVIERMIVEEQIVELTNYDKLAIDYFANVVITGIHIEPVVGFCLDCYNNPNIYKDIYSYFRYDFISWNRCIIKLAVVAIIFCTPVAIYESFEYGFPKEYLYFIPILIYSTIMIYFATINYENFSNFVKNSWFFKENLNIPEIYEWEEYLYLSDMESYPLNKIKKFYSYISTESINIPQREPWEDYVYQSDHDSIIKKFFNKFIKPYVKLPNPKRPKWLKR